jgi:hypothetical protein
LNTNLYLLLENLLFLVLATSFIVIVGWAWRQSKPFSLPEPELIWIRKLLIIEIVLWTLNLDLSQLPRLLRWEVQENTDTFSE